MRALLAALIVCLVGFASQAQSREIGGPYDMYAADAPAHVAKHKEHGHATTARRIDRMPVTHHQVAHVEPSEAHGSGVVTVETAARIPITVAAAVASKFQDLIADLVEHGYMPKDIGCFARGGHIRHSFHYRGLACDIDQDARNVTARFMHSKEAHALIREHGLDDGCDFGDCGHVSYGEIGGGRHYARHYASHRRRHYAGA